MGDFTAVGRIRDAHGLKGELFVALKAKQADWLDDVLELQLNRGEFVSETLTVVEARPHKDGLIVSLEGILDRTQAEAYKGATVSIDSELLIAEPGERLFLGELIGRKVKDETLGMLGPVVEISTNGAQDLLVVETVKGKFDIPLVDDFIVEISDSVIEMKLPEGLVEV